jgi:hypothetical protein
MKFPKAAWHGPVPNMNPGAMGEIRGLCLHIMQSLDNGTLPPHHSVDTIEGCDGWFHDTVSQVSAHFGTGTAGELFQWVDTHDLAWAEVAGNGNWISIENSGVTGDSLLPSQIESVAQVLAWLHETYAVPLQSTDDPNVGGLGWHGMGGQAWGGHLECPGQPILDQRPAIIARAAAIVNPPTEDNVTPHDIPIKIGPNGQGETSTTIPFAKVGSVTPQFGDGPAPAGSVGYTHLPNGDAIVAAKGWQPGETVVVRVLQLA